MIPIKDNYSISEWLNFTSPNQDKQIDTTTKEASLEQQWI